jgi:CheY-like chemotaxis protein
MRTLSRIENEIKILLVEDNPADVKLASLALEASSLPYVLSILSNGESAEDFLKQSGPYAGSPRPDIVFLDLNLPRRNGVEVLWDIKQDPALKDIPVVVLTVSNDPRIIQEAYDAGANLFMTKPTDLGEFSSLFEYVSRLFTKGGLS